MQTMLAGKRVSRLRRLGLGALLVLLGGIGLAPWRVVAQTGSLPSGQKAVQDREDSFENALEWVSRSLGLSADQKVQFRALVQDVRQQARTIKADPALSGKERKERALALLETTEKRFKALLTPAQLQHVMEMGGMKALLPLAFGASQATIRPATIADIEKDMAQTGSLLAQVGLTPVQRARLQQILAAGHNQALALLNNRALSDEQRMVALKQLHGTAQQQILALLTPQQRQRLFAIQQSALLAKVNKGFAWIADQMLSGELTDAQRARLQGIVISAQKQAAALFGNPALTDEQRMAAIKQLHEAAEQQALAILTPEQRQKLEEIKQSILEKP